MNTPRKIKLRYRDDKDEDVNTLLSKVSMNSAFLKLASEDNALIKEMQQAILTLFEQASKREMVYLAIEHNCKYLSILAEQSHTERVIAVKDADETR